MVVRTKAALVPETLFLAANASLVMVLYLLDMEAILSTIHPNLGFFEGQSGHMPNMGRKYHGMETCRIHAATARNGL